MRLFVTSEKFKVKQVCRALGYRDFIALVGREMRGLDILREFDDLDHETRMFWFFNPQTTGLRLIDLDNHSLVLFTVEFPTEIFESDCVHSHKQYLSSLTWGLEKQNVYMYW